MRWIRVVYLYLFTCVGLVLVTVGGAQMVNLGLRTFVLTEADAEARIRPTLEPPLRIAPAWVDSLAADGTLDEDTRAALRQWTEDYEEMREEREAIDPVRSRRQRDLAGALGLLIVGTPLFLYHWRVIRAEGAGMQDGTDPESGSRA